MVWMNQYCLYYRCIVVFDVEWCLMPQHYAKLDVRHLQAAPPVRFERGEWFAIRLLFLSVGTSVDGIFLVMGRCYFLCCALRRRTRKHLRTTQQNTCVVMEVGSLCVLILCVSTAMLHAGGLAKL